ncbi:Bug family tripartite tricarboxylate transporter substrate binding protein [Verminephrobacter aporrectodeae]|uniref:Bug family tripartite tricarboxylate transporter substrate binding protein n=1 Tax=Verminephrobacter aporrectodeae TaxID=1110389 RepID=UPI002242DB02|nr:tripartite tricarboxylate transporter substrate binding protein [Verminephrobacter aporrectodeae]MCW8174123.1 tripartite tricarboxylate transporter substrate binding protein [Verminephrobacter aporrectodeae subsp. tuberculatae]MCW8201908.1 tripartite tricarboxylate transporter substrate binding protein [Verminephrobacter aporrectodeae subsp. tuberculatae]MCW8205811.1 tripartite tricarboxylate transporter substrate binding protein [Verminephrobacter aporrectodeae subsp. tuberculatae]
MSPSIRRRFLGNSIAFIGLAGAACAGAWAQPAYPARSVTIVVPHPAGGSVDSVARLYADKLRDTLGVAVVIENRAGASGMIGAEYVARAAPDGYTLYLNASIHSINPLLYRKMKFDAVRDFTPVSLLAQGALIFSVNPQVPANTVQELVAKVRATPDKYNFVTSGYGSAGHLGIAQFLHENQLTGMPLALYKGSAPALTDLVGGQVSAMMDPFLSSLPYVKAGKLRALAVTGRERSPLLPDVPTLRESGMKDFELYSWYGLWAPAKLPAPILDLLQESSAKIMALPEIRARLATFGFDPAYKNSADFAKFIDAETLRYKGVIEAAHIAIE